jgi:hypothetical protein
MVPANYHAALADAAWKVRLEAAEQMVAWVSEDGVADGLDSEVLMRFLCKTPGWGEKNFQVSAKLYQVMQIMAERSSTFGKPAASLIIGPLTDKLGRRGAHDHRGEDVARVHAHAGVRAHDEAEGAQGAGGRARLDQATDY